MRSVEVEAVGHVVSTPAYALVSGDFTKAGGMDRANFALAHRMAERGHEVHLVAHAVARELREHRCVSVHEVAKPAGSYLLGGPLLDRAGRRVAREIRQRGGRAVVNGGNCSVDDVNWMHHVHAADGLYPPTGLVRRWKRRLDYWLALREEARVVPRSRLVLTTCERTKGDIVTHLGLAPERVRPVHLGIDAERFQPISAAQRAAVRREMDVPLGRPMIAFVGALGNRRKGFDTLFDAWRELCRDTEWDVDLAVVGRGAEVPHWRRLSELEGIGRRVRFLGFVPNLALTLAACDAFVLPSRYEGYSVATQEALCCGIPALVTASAGIAERYPEELRELLIPDPDDARDLAARLRRWRSEMDRCRDLVADFGETLRGFTWDDMADGMIAEIEASA